MFTLDNLLIAFWTIWGKSEKLFSATSDIVSKLAFKLSIATSTSPTNKIAKLSNWSYVNPRASWMALSISLFLFFNSWLRETICFSSRSEPNGLLIFVLNIKHFLF